jgi:hypothetical protein
MKKKIEKAITADDIDEGELFCDECNKEIKWGDKKPIQG